VDIVKAERPDAVLVAGDLYDRAIPPPDAVEVLDDILCQLVLGLKVPVIAIAGNHDSPDRLNFGSRLLAQGKLHVVGRLPAQCAPIVIHDKAGPVWVHAIPYAEPSVVRQHLGCEQALDHDSAMGRLLEQVRLANPEGRRSIILAHAFVAGGLECTESERPLSVGGAGTVDMARFSPFHYTALGHLHRPQSLNGGSIRYCGSLLKYSFDEVDQQKGVNLVEMAGNGECAVTSIPINPKREARRIAGLMADLLKGPNDRQSRDDYLEITVLDEGPVLDAIGRLREVYPNVMNIRRPERAMSGTLGDRPDIRGKTAVQLFSSFYNHVSGEELNDQQQAAFVSVADAVASADRGS